MPRTITKNTGALLIPEGGVEIPEVRDSTFSVTLVLRAGFKGTNGLHWHGRKTEILQVIQGHAVVTVGDKTGIFGPEDGIITVPPNTLHEFGRADDHPAGASSKDIDLRIKEWTEPADRQKELFFRNIMGVVMDRQPTFLGNVKAVLSLAMVMKEHDNYPVIWAGPRILGKAVQAGIRRWTTYLLQGAVAGIGRLCGLKGTYEEYTPDDLLEQVRRSY